MAVRISQLAPPAALKSPDAETREQGLRALRLELEATSDPQRRALLEHEIARSHELRDDLAAAARDELSATKSVGGFIEPLESLIDIATRSRSKANLTKLLERLSKLARGEEEQVRAALGLATTAAAAEQWGEAQAAVEAGLRAAPKSPTLWLLLELIAYRAGDEELKRKATTGRAAHAQSAELRCLLLERSARQSLKAGRPGDAFASIKQSLDEMPTLRALELWESTARASGKMDEARAAAVQTATVLRAVLEEPDEAALYQVPPSERASGRASAAQVRAIRYALQLEDTSEAKELAEQLVDASPNSPLALALLGVLVEKEGNPEESLALLERMFQIPSLSDPEREVLAVLGASRSGLFGAAQVQGRFFDELRSRLNDSLLLLLPDWSKALAAEDEQGVLSFLDRLSTFQEEKDALLAKALVLIESDRAEEARALLEGSRSWTGPLGLLAAGLRRLIARLRDDTESYQRESRGVAELTQDPALRSSLKWEALRHSLSVRGLEFETGPALETGPAAENSLAALSDGRFAGLLSAVLTPADPDGSMARAIDTYFAAGREPPLGEDGPLEEASEASLHLRKVLALLTLVEGGDAGLLAQLFAKHPENPFLAGAAVAHARRQGKDQEREVRQLAAEHAEDPSLRSAWLLRNAAVDLAHGSLARAEEGISAVEGLSAEVRRSLGLWFDLARTKGEPQKVHDLLSHLPTASSDLRLLRAGLLRKFQPETLEDFWSERASEDEQILRIMDSAQRSSESLDYALGASSHFSEAERSALYLARTHPLEEANDLLREAVSLDRALGNLGSHLLVLTAARRARAPREEALALLKLSVLDPSLLPAVPFSDLPEADRATQRLALLRLRDGDQKDEAHNDDPVSGVDPVAAAWALLEEGGDEVSEQHAADMERLGVLLDETLKDPDAQLACLVSAYERMHAGDFAGALSLFERLSRVLPDDLTVCHGLKLVAERLDRPDLEASANAELAKGATDNHSSARLWERAGVLYQDRLNNPVEAERCFTAALARSPGTPLSFERLYRFARSRTDRGRQVELIDARLDTAESESLRIELFWEKARLCRMLGRRAASGRALSELLKLDPAHLPALALSAELYLVDAKLSEAAEALRAIALHPETPDAERSSSGVFACDLLEQQKRHREAVELLKSLDDRGLSGSAGLLRKARSLARTEDWGEAYKAFDLVNQQEDDIEARLSAAQMMLAIQRDHLREPEELKRAARSVLRDAPTDTDAVGVVLEQTFSGEERRRLLAGARVRSQKQLRNFPLDPEEIRLFSRLCEDSGDDGLLRVALGNLGLTGKLTEEAQLRLESLRARCPSMPSFPWSESDLELASDPGQLGALGVYATLLSPYIGAEIEPSLDGLGVSPLMRVDEFSGDPLRAEVGTWMAAFNCGDFQLYVGGTDPRLIRVVPGDMTTIVLGSDIQTPLSPLDRARLAAQISAVRHGTSALLNHAPEEIREWLLAAEMLAGRSGNADGSQRLDEMARSLSKHITREVRDRLTRTYDELRRTQVDVTQTPEYVTRGAARAAVLAYGDVSVLRLMPELLPVHPEARNEMLAEILRFVLSEEFLQLRKKAGLEGA